MKRYKRAVCGGTFDLLHTGHKNFLKEIFEKSARAIIGLTSDKYTQENKEVFESFETRKKSLGDYLASIKVSDRAEIVPIDDIYGPLLDKDLNVDVLFVTSETFTGAEKINQKRENLGLPAVKVEAIEMEKAQDGEFISSSRIRNGEISRDGKVYIDPKWIGKRLILPQSLRGELAKPFGKILQQIPDHLNPEQIITIGDITTQMFNQKNSNQFLSIVDFVVKRERKFDQLSELGFDERIETQIVENPAAEISWGLFEAIKKSLAFDRGVVLVNGEEDLAVLPAILIAPLEFIIYYGQPNVGLVEVVITEEKKKEAKNLADKFELS